MLLVGLPAGVRVDLQEQCVITDPPSGREVELSHLQSCLPASTLYSAVLGFVLVGAAQCWEGFA